MRVRILCRLKLIQVPLEQVSAVPVPGAGDSFSAGQELQEVDEVVEHSFSLVDISGEIIIKFGQGSGIFVVYFSFSAVESLDLSGTVRCREDLGARRVKHKYSEPPGSVFLPSIVRRREPFLDELDRSSFAHGSWSASYHALNRLPLLLLIAGLHYLGQLPRLWWIFIPEVSGW